MDLEFAADWSRHSEVLGLVVAKFLKENGCDLNVIESKVLSGNQS